MTLVVGHRGASAYRPENTFPSYELAVDQGVDAIELDVHLTADGHLAVIHDETLDRTTDRTGPVAGLTMDQIREADAGAAFAGEDGSHPFAGQGLTVPTLSEVLDWLPDGVGLVVEIKARAAVDATIAALSGSRVRAANAVNVISFDEASIEQARALDPELPTGLLLVPFDKPERGLTWAVERGHLGVYPWDGDLGLDPTPPDRAGQRLRSTAGLLRRQRCPAHAAARRRWALGLRHRYARRRPCRRSRAATPSGSALGEVSQRRPCSGRVGHAERNAEPAAAHPDRREQLHVDARVRRRFAAAGEGSGPVLQHCSDHRDLVVVERTRRPGRLASPPRHRSGSPPCRRRPPRPRPRR